MKEEVDEVEEEREEEVEEVEEEVEEREVTCRRYSQAFSLSCLVAAKIWLMVLGIMPACSSSSAASPPSIVKVLPLPVCPYANTQTL